MGSAEKRYLLGTLGFLSFCSVYASVVVIPVLVAIAGEFGTTAGTAGLVAAAFAGPGIVIALVSGPYSDRLGRRKFLVAGSILMGAGTLLGALAPTFEILLLGRAIAGVGASVIFPNVNAIVGDAFGPQERGRALATVIGLNTFASIVGIPLAGLVAEATSWRVSVGFVGLLAITAGAGLARALPADRPAGIRRGALSLYRRILASRSAMAALGSSLLGSVFWFTWATFFVVFFQRRYDLSLGAASTIGLTLGVGILLGSQVGGRLADARGPRVVAGITVLLAGVLLLVQTGASLPLVAGAALNLLLSVVIGARFASNQSLLSDQVPEARATVFAISASLASVAMVAGASIGGLLIDAFGFAAIGLFCLVIAAAASAVTFTLVDERPAAAAPVRAAPPPPRSASGRTRPTPRGGR